MDNFPILRKLGVSSRDHIKESLDGIAERGEISRLSNGLIVECFKLITNSPDGKPEITELSKYDFVKFIFTILRLPPAKIDKNRFPKR